MPGDITRTLPPEFTFLAEDIPRPAGDDEPGRSLPDRVLSQLCQALPELDAHSGASFRVAAELLIDTGRRPEEICRLPWDCLAISADGKSVLKPSWTGPFTGLSPHRFRALVTALRREGADAVRPGRPWSLPLEDQVLLVTAYWRTNLTMRQLAPLFGISKSSADRIIDQVGPLLALRPRLRFAKDTVLIVGGTLVPTRDHTVAEQAKNYRYSTNHQVVIDADTRLVVLVDRPLPGNRMTVRRGRNPDSRLPSARP